MVNNKLITEDKIFCAAYYTFLLFGYHATKIQLIATNAGVNKAAIHYYFRSKENLYTKIVENILNNILTENSKIDIPHSAVKNKVWFLTTELYNNKKLFEQTLKGLYPNNWEKKLVDIQKWIELASVQIDNT